VPMMQRAIAPKLLILRTALLFGCVFVALVTVSAERPTDLVNKRITGTVTRVVDGDTIDVMIPPGRKVRVRLHGVDTPESGEPFSEQATRFARVLMFAREIEVTGKDVDGRDRLVARVRVNQTDASEAIIAAGVGCTFRRYVSDPILETAQDRARASRAGFWAAGVRQPKCVARELGQAVAASARAPIAESVIGNTSTKVYHSPTCRNASCRNCTRTFATRAAAEAAGFRPARDCIKH